MYGPRVVCLPDKQHFRPSLVNNSYPFNKSSQTRQIKARKHQEHAHVVGHKIQFSALVNAENAKNDAINETLQK